MTDGAALAYLAASGATAISIFDDGTIKAGKPTPRRDGVLVAGRRRLSR